MARELRASDTGRYGISELAPVGSIDKFHKHDTPQCVGVLGPRGSHVLVPRAKEEVTLDDILDFIFSRPSKDQQSFEASLRWYFSRNRFVFHSAKLVEEGTTFAIEVSVGTPSGQTETVRVPVPSERVAFSTESAERVASAVLKSIK